MDKPEIAVNIVRPQLLDKRQMSARLQVSTQTLSRLIKRGLPCIKLGYRTLRFDEQAVLLWVRQNYQTINF